MLEDVKAWIKKQLTERQRSSLRNQLVQHLSGNHYDRAVEVGRALYTLEKEFLGPAHEATIQTLAALAAVLIDAGKSAEAEPCWRELLEKRRQTVGEKDPSVGQTLRMLARLTLRLNRPVESVEFYEQALALQLKVLGEEHKETDTTLRELEELKKDLALKKPASSAASQAASSANALLPPGTVIFAVWIRKDGETAAAPLLLGDFDDAFGDRRGITIGSGADCKVVLEDPGVAPLHLHIEDKGGTRKMHVLEKVVIPDESWEHPIPVVETIFEPGTLVEDPIAFLALNVGPYQIAYRELRDRDAEELVRHVQSPESGKAPPDAPILVSRARGPFLPRDRENPAGGRYLVGVFVAPGLAARVLTSLGAALGSFREKQPYVARIEGLQELFSGRYPVFGDVPRWVAINGGSEPLIGAADSCLLVECKGSVTVETVIADLQSIVPAGTTSAIQPLANGAIRLGNFKRRKAAGEAAPGPVSAQAGTD